MIQLTIEAKTIRLSAHEQGLATGAHARTALMPTFLAAIVPCTSRSSMALTISETALGRMIVKYSEQSVFQPLKEIRHWFTYTSGAYPTPGYPPLYYGRDKNRNVSPNVSAVAAIGEGVAGLICQRVYRCRKLARPNHDYPDIVLEGRGMTYLVEAKATLNPEFQDIEEVVNSEIARLASLVSSAARLDMRDVRGLLVGTQLVSETDYRCSLVEMVLV